MNCSTSYIQPNERVKNIMLRKSYFAEYAVLGFL